MRKPKNRLTPSTPMPNLTSMEVHLNSELQQKLGLLAAQQGMTSEALVVEAVERMVSHDEWFLREVEKGLEEADRGDLIDHAEVRRIIDQRYPG